MRTLSSRGLPLMALLCAASAAHAQTRDVSGRVLSALTQEPLPGAIVSVLGRPTAAQANERGQFRITVPAGDVTLLARVIGYKRNQVIVPAAQATVDIPLERDVLQLEGLVVTGQATTSERRNASTAVAVVSADQLTGGAPPASLENALQGKVVGANINMNNGAPGGGGQIQIRGVTSILGNGQPLFVIDGVLINNNINPSGANSLTRASGGSIANVQDNSVNRVADLNPNDIEDIQILKSAAASAIYGSKATNGVVLITTKRGKQGAPKVTITQRVGTYQAIRLLGSRHFKSLADALTAVEGPGAAAAATAACNPTCPYYDYQGELFGQHDPSYETVASVSGGSENTKYYVSGTNKFDAGTMLNTGDKRQSLRFNLDQNLGARWNGSMSATILRSFTQRGLSNNDNAQVSPVYVFGHTQALIDLDKRDAAGNYPENPFALGGAKSSNPFQTMAYIANDEDVYRQIGSGRLNYTPLTTERHSVVFSLLGGFDIYTQDNRIYSPNFLQYEPADGLLGTAVQSNALSRQFNSGLNAVWTFTPASKRVVGSFTTSSGVQYEQRDLNSYNVRASNLIPSIDLVNQGVPTLFQQKTGVRDQAFYVNEEILALSDRLSVAGRVRAERSSVNGDRDQLYYWPAGSASYRFVAPFRHADEIKFRVAFGTSGNQARYGDRDQTLNGIGLIEGRNALGDATTVGNDKIKPEKMTEQEYGVDAFFAGGRVGLEASYYDRRITDLLLTAPLGPSSGFTQRVINGGRMRSRGTEVGLTLLPVRSRNFEWVSRTSFYKNESRIEDLPVPDFAVSNSGFGAQYGRSRIAKGYVATLIWGNKKRPDGTVVDTVIGDANPKFNMQFGQDVRFKTLSLNVLLDWRKGGLVSDMTQNTFDEKKNAWDHDKPSPDPTMTLGAYRFAKWDNGRESSVYIQDGSFVKLREVTLSYQVPPSWVARIPGASKDMRLSLSGRNLVTWSGYWSFDPEVSNFGNQNVTRFVDLTPYPPSRSFFFSVDVGF